MTTYNLSIKDFAKLTDFYYSSDCRNVAVKKIITWEEFVREADNNSVEFIIDKVQDCIPVIYEVHEMKGNFSEVIYENESRDLCAEFVENKARDYTIEEVGLDVNELFWEEMENQLSYFSIEEVKC